MRKLLFACAAAALFGGPAIAQEMNATTAEPATVENAAAAPAADADTANEIVLAPGEATTAVPVAPVEPLAPVENEDDDGGFPWGVLGLIGLVGLLGRNRGSRSD